MKFLHASHRLGDIARLRSALDSAGIEYTVRNELLSGLTGEIPLNECTPEIWVSSEEQFEEARRIVITVTQRPVIPGPAWTCAQCGEKIEGQFDSCWHCGALQPESAAVSE